MVTGARGRCERTIADNDGGWQQQHPVDGDNVSWQRWPLDAVAVDNKAINKCKKKKQTHHHVSQLGDGLDVGPDLFAMGLREDGAVDMLTTEQPHIQSRCSGRSPLGWSLSRMTSCQRISTTLMLVPKNSRKSRALVDSNLT